jgi:hypothetical protein
MSYSSNELDTIATLRKVLETAVTERNHIVIEDFNLYYLL